MFSQKQKWVGATAFAAVLISSSLTGLTPSQAAVPSVVSGIQAANIVRTGTIDKSRMQTQVYSGIPPAEVSLITGPLNVLADTFNSQTIASAQTSTTEQATANKAKPQAKPDSSESTKKSSAPAKPVQTAKASNPAQLSRGGSSQVSSIIERALSLRGVPYLWGGTTPKGFDCSGFVQYVFAASGIKLPRTSFDQYKVGTPVARDQLQVGDLVFFSTYSSGASDVRIYIGGGRTIGSSSDGVAIHSLSESYWSKRYIGARRVL